MLKCEQTVLVLVDMQAKLVPAMNQSQSLVDNVCRLIRGLNVLGVPILHTEQNPAGLGPTVQDVAQLLNQSAVEKMAFSCCGEKSFLDALAFLDRRQVLLAGIEAHVCVYQTAMDLLGHKYGVHVVADAIASRTPENRQIALAKMSSAKAEITSVEMLLFELLGSAQSPAFKEMLRIVK